ncbi:Universal stress protein A-like protein [Acorus gramineus]|uniref:Universal stress protein A-like protein n=1 Tax=Acorus gramineus TaxID=55184 RepID=A0AAV9AVI8_ACOGR|nr:Universal stress protein A-like protein [Acorus gramineus]
MATEEMKKKQKVMVAIDESECSHHALEWALDNLRDSILSSPSSASVAEERTLIVYTAQPLTNLSYLTAASYGSAPPELVRSLQENQKKIALALLEQAKEICAKRGVVAETITEAGDPKEAICEAVDKLKVNLLIMGNHGRGPIRRVFLGSVSNYCVHNAKCPVLVVKKTG